ARCRSRELRRGSRVFPSAELGNTRAHAGGGLERGAPGVPGYDYSAHRGRHRLHSGLLRRPRSRVPCRSQGLGCRRSRDGHRRVAICGIVPDQVCEYEAAYSPRPGPLPALGRDGTRCQGLGANLYSHRPSSSPFGHVLHRCRTHRALGHRRSPSGAPALDTAVFPDGGLFHR
ncbi:hypothetical protein NGA_2129320, partial [Nannochloropsis gaditana CCMP526]|uniref:uncharacterized protein n=1 Tax=Nannochloropsis gaditana (strain CCMP526) TaxID=1093141 RepID=UPI00029F6BE4